MAARDAAKHPKWTGQLLMRKNHLTQKVVSDVKKPHVDHLLGSCKMGRKWPAFPPGCNRASVLRKQAGLFAGGGGSVVTQGRKEQCERQSARRWSGEEKDTL